LFRHGFTVFVCEDFAMSRGERWDFQQAQQKITRPVNGQLKRKERARRDALLTQLLKKGTLPYTPTVMSWLSLKLDKPARYIKPEDVQEYLKDK
jgi:hypothetical protein